MNSLIDFIEASDCKKRNIVRNQKNPPIIKAAKYSSVRHVFSKYSLNDFDDQVLKDTFERIKKRDTSTQWRKDDVRDSIAAIRHFIRMNFPSTLKNINCSFAKATIKECWLSGVQIHVSPDMIIKWVKNDKTYVGAVKFRISKSKLDSTSGITAAALLTHYLKEYYQDENVIVAPQYCLYVDIMEELIYSAPSDSSFPMSRLVKACDEINILWKS